MPPTQPPYASAYAAHGRRAKTPEPALVLAPGTHRTRLGFAGAPVPAATLPASAVPMHSAGAFASALLLSAAEHLLLPSSALHTHTLIVAVPPSAFPAAARAAVTYGALRLLHMRRLVLVPAAPAAALAAGAPHAGAAAVVVDVGWSGARVCAGPGGAPRAAAPAGMRDMAAVLLAAGVAEADLEDALGAVYVRGMGVEGGEEKGGPAVGEGGRVVVAAGARWGAGEAVFAGGELARAVAAVVRGLDADGRAAAGRWVVATGGAACVPGFCARLQEEVAVAVGGAAGERVRVVAAGPAAAWVGASLLGCVGEARWGEMVEVLEGVRGGEEVVR